jgi:hypothetical protein
LTFPLACEPFLEDVGAMTDGVMRERLELRQESGREELRSDRLCS